MWCERTGLYEPSAPRLAVDESSLIVADMSAPPLLARVVAFALDVRYVRRRCSPRERTTRTAGSLPELPLRQGTVVLLIVTLGVTLVANDWTHPFEPRSSAVPALSPHG